MTLLVNIGWVEPPDPRWQIDLRLLCCNSRNCATASREVQARVLKVLTENLAAFFNGDFFYILGERMKARCRSKLRARHGLWLAKHHPGSVRGRAVREVAFGVGGVEMLATLTASLIIVPYVVSGFILSSDLRSSVMLHQQGPPGFDRRHRHRPFADTMNPIFSREAHTLRASTSLQSQVSKKQRAFVLVFSIEPTLTCVNMSDMYCCTFTACC